MIPEHWLRYISNQVNATIRMAGPNPEGKISIELDTVAIAAYKSILAVEAEAFKNLRETYIPPFQTCVKNEDSIGLGQLVDEMTEWEFSKVFGLLNNYHRGQVRNLLNDYHAEKRNEK